MTQGATTAATITIDWQSLRYYYFHFSRMLFRALSGTRSTSSTNSRSTHLSPVSQLDAEGGVLSVDHPHTINNSEEENDIMKCCSCAHSPAEVIFRTVRTDFQISIYMLVDGFTLILLSYYGFTIQYIDAA